MQLALRPYQEDALAAITKAEANNQKRIVVAHATGLGKTVLFAHVIAGRDGRHIVLVHRDELVRQTVDKLSHITPHLSVGVVKAEQDQVDAQVVVASVQTLARPNRMARITPDFTTVVVDEAHHATADTWRRVLGHLRVFGGDGPLCLGVTATPERGDRVGLDSVFDEVVHTMSILDGIIAGYLVDLRGQLVGTDMDLSKIRVRNGDLVESELGAEMERTGAIDHISDAWLEHAADRKTLAFLPTVATAHQLADTLRDRGVAAEAIDGATPIDHRRAVLDRLRTGETRVLANCAVLTEGFDEPSIDCVLVARPTRSRPFYTQMVGRGTRLFPGKTDTLVLDVVGVTGEHVLTTLSTLAGKPPRAMGNKSVGELAAEDADRRPDPNPIPIAKGRRVVDLFRSTLRWLPVEDAFCLPAGDTTVIIAPDAGGWQVLTSTKTGVTTLARDLDIGYAQGYGEDIARREGHGLADRNARWLTRPPTPAQLSLLRDMGLKDPSRVTTRGDASDLITRVKARSVVRRLTQQKASA